MSTRGGFIERLEPVVHPKTRYLKEREVAFSELLGIFTNIANGKEFVLRLTGAAKKYTQFLSVSDREPFNKAIDDWNTNFLNPHQKERAWARILSVVMSSGVNRCDVKSPGISEVSRLIPLSPFRDSVIVAHVTAFAIISPNEILESSAHHEDYQKVRRLVYEVVAGRYGINLCMGAEYFVATRKGSKMLSITGVYILEVVPPIDRRE